MSIKYEEDLKDIQVVKKGDLLDVIVSVKWVLTATHSDGRVQISDQVVFLDEPDEKTFSEYSSLTKEEVREWIKKYITDDMIKNRKEGVEAIFEEDLIFEEPKSKEAPWENN